MLRIVRFISLLVALVGLIVTPSLATAPLDGGGPVVVSTSHSSAQTGQVVTFTVYLDGPASGVTPLSISATPGSFISIPSAILPEEGVTSVSFQATIGLSIYGTVSLNVTDGSAFISSPIITLTDTVRPF